MTQLLTLAGKEYVLLEREEFERMTASPGSPGGQTGLPPLPAADKEGNVPAIAYGRALLARRLILARRRAGLTQVELARRARLRPETINRLERGRHNPDQSTYERIEKVLGRCGVRV
jgi:DNA-binding XRE family transcriptional regulator